MPKSISSTQKSYLAGFLDADGSIYVQAKPNKTYRFGFQIAPYIVFYQSSKDAKDTKSFSRVCSLIKMGHRRLRKDGIIEHAISRQEEIISFIKLVEPYVIMKKSQIALLKRIISLKKKVRTRKDFKRLMNIIDQFRKLNYSKKRKRRTLTP
jgi:hypothetical protein